MQPYCSYLICATPHSGSALLCEALKNTGIAGWPEEYFKTPKNTGVPTHCQEYSAFLENTASSATYLEPVNGTAQASGRESRTYANYLPRIIEEATSHNGVFGAKVMWSYFDAFICNLRQIPLYRETAIYDLLPAIFPNLHYICVTRYDKVRQAVSLWKAIQIQDWQPGEPPPPDRELVFDFEMIDHLAQQIALHEADWRQYFSVCGMQPFLVLYEELVLSYENTILNILHHLQIPIPGSLRFPKRPLKLQADALSEEWVQHYHNLKRERQARILVKSPKTS